VQQQQQQAVKSTVTSLASMSLGRNTVLGTGAPPTNGTAVAVAATSGTPAVQQTTSYSPTPIQRPPGGKGKGGMPNEASVNDDVAAPSAALDVTGSKDKSDVED